MPVAFQSSKPLIEKVSQVVQQQQLTAKVGLIVSGDISTAIAFGNAFLIFWRCSTLPIKLSPLTIKPTLAVNCCCCCTISKCDGG
jgi:hypothetical protein